MEEFNLKLKQISTYNELMALIKEAENEGYELTMKRSSYDPFSFDERPDNRVEYLISDGISIENSQIKNLYKNMLFR